jgi:hypothetical protein
MWLHQFIRTKPERARNAATQRTREVTPREKCSVMVNVALNAGIYCARLP